jgi:hypothetical protein
VDKTPPDIILTTPEDGATYLINRTIPVSFSVSDALSGIASVTATSPDASLLDTSTAGGHPFTVSAMDVAGNSNTVIHNYNVIFPGNIDPGNEGLQYAWAENAGWMNFKPSYGPGVTVTDSAVTGMAWSENAGWINLEPMGSGVTNDGLGNLSGYAWGENTGWISFSCANTASCATVPYGVSIDPVTGVFSGQAWAENMGWIQFASTGQVAFGIKTAWGRDSDGDGILDRDDNCIDRPNGPLVPDAGGQVQRDSNDDGFGNVCDPDLNDDGAVNFADLGMLKSVFFTANADADFNGDGAVNFTDLGTMKSMFFGPPGPSGLSP